MENNERLRKQVRLLKAEQGITYKELSNYLPITESSFYNYMKGYFNMSADNQIKLQEVIDILKE